MEALPQFQTWFVEHFCIELHFVKSLSKSSQQLLKEKTEKKNSEKKNMFPGINSCICQNLTKRSQIQISLIHNSIFGTPLPQ